MEAAGATADATAEHWETVARRTRGVAEQWRTLHATEEARANAALHKVADAAEAVQRMEADRDAALQRAAEAMQALATAKQERARWRARSDAQTASKTYLQLEQCRKALSERDGELTTMMRAYEALQQEFDAYETRKNRKDAETASAARDRLEALMRQREDALAESKTFEEGFDKLRGELSEHLVTSPPGALAESRAQCAKQEAAINELEMKNVTLKRENARLRDRARGAIASERMAQLKAGPHALPSPARQADEFPIRGAAAAAMLQSELGGGVPGAVALGRLSAQLSAPILKSSAAEIGRLHAEVDFHRAEAEHERRRQRSFQERLWRSEAFSQAQKLKAIKMLREPDEEDEQQLDDISASPRAITAPGQTSPLVGNLALARPRRA